MLHCVPPQHQNQLTAVAHQSLTVLIQRSATVCGPVGSNSMSIHPIFLDVDSLTSPILFFFSLFVDNVEMINP